MTALSAAAGCPSLEFLIATLRNPTGEEDVVRDWLAWYLLTRPAQSVSCPALQAVLIRLLLEEVTTICTAARPEVDPGPLARYLTRGRGALLLTGLVLAPAPSPVHPELSPLLLSLAAFLNSERVAALVWPGEPPVPAGPALLPAPQSPQFHCSAEQLGRKKRKKSLVSHRGMRQRERASREREKRNDSSGEEGRAGEEELRSSESVLEVHLKPVDTFAYFDTAGLESDAVARQGAVGRLPRPPLPPYSSPVPAPTLARVCLELLCRQTAVNASCVALQRVICDLAGGAAGQLEAGPSSSVTSLLTCLTCNCLAGLRYRPDLVAAAPARAALAALSLVISSPQRLHSTQLWARAARCCLLVSRGPARPPGLLAAVLAGLADDTVQGETRGLVLQAVVQHLLFCGDRVSVLDSVPTLLTASLHPSLSLPALVRLLTSLRTLLSSLPFPAEQLPRLTRLLPVLPPASLPAFLAMLEQAVENLTECEDWAGEAELERDSALASSEPESGQEDKRTVLQQPQLELDGYLELARRVGPEGEAVFSSMERLALRGDGRTRHLLAQQVILPFLAVSLSDQKVDPARLELALEILCRLVVQQPTALLLIRDQQVWRQIKQQAGAAGSLARVSLRLVKTLVLNSNKFTKIRLSEAEAMALQDEETDLINFDQRDRNAQYWVLKQFYHVLVQASVPLVGGDRVVEPSSWAGLAAVWAAAGDLLDLTQPFRLFALERGMVGLGQQLFSVLLQRSSLQPEHAELLGTIVQFFILVRNNDHWIPKNAIPHLENSNLEEYMEKNVFPHLRNIISKENNFKSVRVILNKVLEGSTKIGLTREESLEESVDDNTDDGYDADESEIDFDTKSGNEGRTSRRVSYKAGLEFYTFSLLHIASVKTFEQPEEKLYMLEYLLFKLVKLELDTETLLLLDETILGGMLDELFNLAQKGENSLLIPLSMLVSKLFGKLAKVFVSSLNIKKMFRFLANENCLRKTFFIDFPQIISARMLDYKLPSISIVTSNNRNRLSSNLSSDSGLDSNLSISSSSVHSSKSRKHFIKEPVDDLESDFTIITRVKIDSSTLSDEWVELIEIENANQKLGISLSEKKGLKLSLSNSSGCVFAAAETNFQVFQPGSWCHLVLNVGSSTEGNRITKTLSAYIDCCRVWDVGLSSDRRQRRAGSTTTKTSRAKAKLLGLTVGSGGCCKAGGDSVMISDLFILANTVFSLQDILVDFLLESRYLSGGLEYGGRVNLARLGDRLPDLANNCLPLVDGSGLSRLSLTASRLLAHFSPSCLWGSSASVEPGLAWTLHQGLSAAGLESVLLLPAAAIQQDCQDSTIALCFHTAIKFLTINHETFQQFQHIGGFSLLCSILRSEGYSPGPEVVESILECCSQDGVLLLPELVPALLSVPAVARGHTRSVLAAVAAWLGDNHHSAFNFGFLLSSSTLQALLDSIVGLAKDRQPLPLAEITEFLSLIPPHSALLSCLLSSCLLICPSRLLYLPCSPPSLPGSSVSEPLPSPPQTAALETIHSSGDAVVDVSSLLHSDTEERILESAAASLRDLDLQYLELEEDPVGAWEVVAGTPSPEAISLPSLPASIHTSDCNTPLLVVLLAPAVAGLVLLPDKESCGLVELPALLPLVAHPDPEVHAPALCLVGQVLARDTKQAEQFLASGGAALLAGLLASHPASLALVEAALALLHGHPVQLAGPFKLAMEESSPGLEPRLAPLLLPLLLAALPELVLAHNLCVWLHELVARLPSLLDCLLEAGLAATLLTALARLSVTPGPQSDVCGVRESDLLVEDCSNLLRLLVLRTLTQPGDALMDLLFLCAGVAGGGGVGAGSPGIALCTILEESLNSLQRALGLAVFTPSQFLDTETCGPEQVSVSGRSGRNLLLERFNKIAMFGVNFLTSETEPNELCEEELGLAGSLYQLLFKLAFPTSTSKVPELAKCWQVGPGAGVLLVTLLNGSLSTGRKIDLIRQLDAQPKLVSAIEMLYPGRKEREIFRLAVLSLASQTAIFDAVDSDLMNRFYGGLLCPTLFPAGPPGELGRVRHPGYGPWLAERARCAAVQVQNWQGRAAGLATIAGSLVQAVVEARDRAESAGLRGGRAKEGAAREAARRWEGLVAGQVHPAAPWYDASTLPRHLLVDSVCGTSRVFNRLVRGEAGPRLPRFYQPGRAPSIHPPPPPFSALLGRQDGISLADRLGGLEQLLRVDPAKQVTAIASRQGELALSLAKVFFVSPEQSWSCELVELEAVCRRRYQLQDTALEFFRDSGESHLLVFQSAGLAQEVAAALGRAGVPSKLRTSNLAATTKLWCQGRITNFQYLMELNRLAGRTGNDLMQYPVFPWVLADYTSPHLNLTLPNTFRNLRKPVAIQKEGSEDKYVENYNVLAADGSGVGGLLGPYHYASHYSNTGIVLHFLVRLPPFTQEFIKFQDGNFDLPDRSFHKLATSWLMASEVSASDVKELIPQLFYLPEMFSNREGFNLGVRQSGQEVDDVELPAWCEADPRTFVKVHRQALESPVVRQDLSHWIDLVFGFKQTGTEAVEAVNVFHPATYPGLAQTTAGLDQLELRARQTMIEVNHTALTAFDNEILFQTYGQTPPQLFSKPHPLPLAELVRAGPGCPVPALSGVTGLVWGGWCGAPGSVPTLVWQQQGVVPVSKLIHTEGQETVGLVGRAALLGRESRGLHLLTWGHKDGQLHCSPVGEAGRERQVGTGLPSWDPVLAVASHLQVTGVWLGHRSGLLSVLSLQFGREGPELGWPDQVHCHTGPVADLKLCPEFGLAASAGAGQLATWDLHSRTLLHSVSLPGPATALAISAASGDLAVVHGTELSLYTINLKRVAGVGAGERVTAVAFSNMEEGVSINCVAVGLQSGTVRLYSSLDLAGLREVAASPVSPVTTLAYSQDSLNLVIASLDGTVTILEKSGTKGLKKTPKYRTLQ